MNKLRDLAAVIKSKNAGPFMITFDIILKDRKSFERVRPLFTEENICRWYPIKPERIVSIVPFPNACAIKFTLLRRVSSGDVGDTSLYGSQQHANLLEVEVPDDEAEAHNKIAQTKG